MVPNYTRLVVKNPVNLNFLPLGPNSPRDKHGLSRLFTNTVVPIIKFMLDVSFNFAKMRASLIRYIGDLECPTTKCKHFSHEN